MSHENPEWYYAGQADAIFARYLEEVEELDKREIPNEEALWHLGEFKKLMRRRLIDVDVVLEGQPFLAQWELENGLWKYLDLKGEFPYKKPKAFTETQKREWKKTGSIRGFMDPEKPVRFRAHHNYLAAMAEKRKKEAIEKAKGMPVRDAPKQKAGAKLEAKKVLAKQSGNTGGDARGAGEGDASIGTETPASQLGPERLFQGCQVRIQNELWWKYLFGEKNFL